MWTKLDGFLGFMKVIPFDKEGPFPKPSVFYAIDPTPKGEASIEDYYIHHHNEELDHYLLSHERGEDEEDDEDYYLHMALFYYWYFDASSASRYSMEIDMAQHLLFKKLEKQKIDTWNDWEIALLAETYFVDDVTYGADDLVNDFEKAEQLFSLALSKGNPYAAFELCSCEFEEVNPVALKLAFESGFDVSYKLQETLLDPESAYFDKGFAEEYRLLSPYLKSRVSTIDVGFRFLEGNGLKKNEKMARKFFALGAKMGFSESERSEYDNKNND